ncbi:hypothetical protein [uncultured Clostridium sp.]|uniref:hypothetical protein n=1 Tax=uncultured Clostridium sp. TaxID=59620 RepID=UPI0028E96588|nr:hypothetical protein [uncultured Clostridium sp.]
MFINNKKTNKEINLFEEQLDEIKEYQKNAFNPGHYVGTGRVNLATKNLFKSSKVLITTGIIFLVPAIYNIIKNFNIVTLLSQTMQIIIGCALIFGGFIRLRRKKH